MELFHSKKLKRAPPEKASGLESKFQVVATQS